MRHIAAPSTTSEPTLDFETFFKAEYQRLLEALYLVVRNQTEAEDIAQEAMVRVYERWGAVREPVRYAYRTAFNLHRSLHRRVLTARKLLVMAPTPIGEEDAVDQRLDVLRALGSLPGGQCEALVLVDLVGMSAEEAGQVIGIRPASVRGRVHRARAALRERIGGQHA
jgi:RNA polymerase sigma-70 factor (ECF subfamily)